jgi:hypothetical protein
MRSVGEASDSLVPIRKAPVLPEKEASRTKNAGNLHD